jgi:ligand-binding sensor domain-containing protein
LFIDSNNNIWCIDYNYFTIYNGINWITDNSSLEKETLFAIAQALDDKIWIGTNNGIYINH